MNTYDALGDPSLAGERIGFGRTNPGDPLEVDFEEQTDFRGDPISNLLISNSHGGYVDLGVECTEL